MNYTAILIHKIKNLYIKFRSQACYQYWRYYTNLVSGEIHKSEIDWEQLRYIQYGIWNRTLIPIIRYVTSEVKVEVLIWFKYWNYRYEWQGGGAINCVHAAPLNGSNSKPMALYCAVFFCLILIPITSFIIYISYWLKNSYSHSHSSFITFDGDWGCDGPTAVGSWHGLTDVRLPAVICGSISESW
jgi:uncharacterized membrane protein